MKDRIKKKANEPEELRDKLGNPIPDEAWDNDLPFDETVDAGIESLVENVMYDIDERQRNKDGKR